MPDLSRRDILRAAAIGSAFSLLPASIRKALAIPANNRTGTLRDVEHVVILMQENRSFDHWSGSNKAPNGWCCPTIWTANAATPSASPARRTRGWMSKPPGITAA